MLTKDETFSFFKLYKARFGEDRMPNDMKRLWYEELKGYTYAQFKTATDQLLSVKQFAFTCKDVKVRINELFGNSELSQHETERQWQRENRSDYRKEERQKIKTCIEKMAEVTADIKTGAISLKEGKERFWQCAKANGLNEHFSKGSIEWLVVETFDMLEKHHVKVDL